MEKRDKAVIAGLHELESGLVEAVIAEADRRIELLEKVLSGDTSDEIPEGLEDTFSGVVFDEDNNSPTLVGLMKKWLVKVIGLPLTELVVDKKLLSQDGITTVVVFTQPVGELEYFLSTWTEGDKKPRYVLWPMEMYDSQLEAGYTSEEQ